MNAPGRKAGVLRPAPVAAVLVLVAVLSIMLPPALPTARAAELAEVLIESVTPAVPTARSTITVAGRVANTGDADIVEPAVQLRLSPLALNSRDEILQIFNGTTQRDGNALPQTRRVLPTTLVPGQQAEFTLRVEVADLGLPADAAGVYALFVELLSGEDSQQTAGTVFSWFPPQALYEPSELAFVWPVVQQPAIAGNELVTQPSLPAEFLPGGRLSRLLDLGEQHNVSWLVDSATLSTAQQLADGYQVPGDDGPVPGDKTAAAGAFAQRLQQLLTHKRHTTMPQYAIGDDDALQRAGLSPFVVRSATLPTVVRDELVPGSDAKVAVVAPGGTMDLPTLETLVDSGVRRVVMADRLFPADPGLSYTPSGVTTMTVAGIEVTVLLTDHLLTRTLARPLTTAAQRSRARQQFLADTAMVTLETPAEPRRLVTAPPLLWSPPPAWIRALMGALREAPWIRLIGLDRVAAAQGAPRSHLGYGDRAALRELPADYVRRIAVADDQLDRLSAIVSDPGGYGQTFRLALQRAGSALWREEPVARNQFLSTVEQQVRQQIASVRVVSSGTVTLAGDNGIVPLTIANDLDQPVTVGLQLATDTPIRLQYTPPDPVRIGPNQKAGLEVPVRVLGSQPMEVRVVLTDRTGELFDDSATIDLRSTAASRIATVVVGVGAVALVVLVGLNLVRRRRGRASDEDAPRQLQDEHV